METAIYVLALAVLVSAIIVSSAISAHRPAAPKDDSVASALCDVARSVDSVGYAIRANARNAIENVSYPMSNMPYPHGNVVPPSANIKVTSPYNDPR